MKTSLGRHVTTPVVVGDIVCVASHTAGLMGIRVTRDGDGVKAEPAWVEKKLAINYSSPVVVETHLYGVGPSQNLICVDARDGKLAWSKEGLFHSASGKTHGGLIVMGKNILLLTDTGELVLFAASPSECQVIGQVQVCGVNWCNPAYAEGRLYLRDAKTLRCIRLLP